MTNEQMIEAIQQIFVNSTLKSISTDDIEANTSPVFKENKTDWHLIERFYADKVEVEIWDKETEESSDYYNVLWEELDGETVQEIYNLLKFLM